MVPGATVPKPWLTRAHPDDIDGLDHQWDRCLDGYVQEGYEWRVLRPGSISFNSEDDIIYLESCALPEMAEDGTMTSVTGLVTDVTIRKAYQREQAKKLDDALEEKRVQEYFMGKFFPSISTGVRLLGHLQTFPCLPQNLLLPVSPNMESG